MKLFIFVLICVVYLTGLGINLWWKNQPKAPDPIVIDTSPICDGKPAVYNVTAEGKATVVHFSCREGQHIQEMKLYVYPPVAQ